MTEGPPTSAALATRRRWLAHKRDRTGTPDFTVGVAASFTADPLEAFLGEGLLRHGKDPAFTFADYNQIHQLCFDPEGTVGAVDAVVVLWRLEDVFAADLGAALGGDPAAAGSVVDAAAELGAALASYSASVSYPVVVSLPPVPAPPGFDASDSAVGVPLTRVHLAATDAFLKAVGDSPVRLADLPAWLREYGTARARDVVKAFTYKQPYTTGFWNELGGHLADLLGRETTPSPKCVVLDCDNTLWGGIIGEDGLGGIALGSAFPGSAFQEFQRVLKRLRDRGILLAVNSKNNHDDVLEVFTKHDDMILKADDIAAWRVNWDTKSQNLRAIAEELNIGEDALVFIDDSHFELAEIAASLPHVTVLQVPEELALLPDLIADSGLFRNLRVSADDAARTERIISERARKEVQATMSPEAFLASLELKVDYFPVDEQWIGRVSQLTNKSNQFNVTTVRRSEAEIRALTLDDDYLVRAIKVSDRFSDYGLVGVGILHRDGETWDVDTLLMSCRVLSRGVETAFLARLAGEAAEAGATTIVGHYVPTQKNMMVAELFPDHGFTTVSEGRFEAAPASVREAPSHITFGP